MLQQSKKEIAHELGGFDDEDRDGLGMDSKMVAPSAQEHSKPGARKNL